MPKKEVETVSSPAVLPDVLFLFEHLRAGNGKAQLLAPMEGVAEFGLAVLFKMKGSALFQ